MRRSPLKLTTATLAALMVAGCSSFSKDGGFADVQGIAKTRVTQDVQWIRSEDDAARTQARVKELLASPLTADSAVQIALLHNRALQATYAELGISEADLVQAGRLRNPLFSFARLTRGAELEIDRAFFVDIMSLITMPLRTDLERRSFELTKVRVGAEIVRVAADTRRAYYRAVA
ncbi:MAG TPA: RND transporter, partial [Burkholderiales bacterium]|nr:RND transporter [Burkholderiales bacterium]